MDGIRIQCNRIMFGQGCMLVLLGILLPMFVTEQAFGIYDHLSWAMMSENVLGLLWAAMLLVLMNTLRAIPHYLGVFLISESLHITRFEKRKFVFNVFITLILILLVYGVIDFIYGIHYDFGIPALMIIMFILSLSYINLFSVSTVNKILLLASLLLSIQWLDVIPPLSRHGFGRGEISMDVKTAAHFMGQDGVLMFFAGCLFLAFLFCSMMQVQLLYKEHKLKISNDKNQKVEKELHDTQLQALAMRSHSEVQSLVHDLKTPLTTVQGLVTLADMMEENSLIREYFGKINTALSNMNLMISEILYENKKSLITTEQLFKLVLPQVSIFLPSGMLSYDNECPKAMMIGNRIRLSRAIINTIENAYHAVDNEMGRISVKVMQSDQRLLIFIEDNGKGISPDKMAHIWELGYSERHSTGLGLSFTRQVVENHHGVIKIESEDGKFTKVTICLEGVKAHE